MKHLYLLSAFIIISTISNSQGIIQGTIFQNDSTVLSSVSVYLENTKLGTSSNASGNFKIINVPSGEYTLITSSVGYKKMTKKIIVKDNEIHELSLVLTESATDLSEFTLAASITGGNTGVKKMPGSAYYISPKELKKFSYTDINRSLRAVPGV
ncbi:MAG: hypothetical protein GW818_00340, partial [Flavobacteriales bacterium]|nr:hypothetical protein [Flavobacteriales bacterium]